MFTTFTSGSDLRSPPTEVQSTRLERNDSSDPSTPPSPHVKRSQVARACDWCRLNRVRCDNNLPCRNCQKKGTWCSNHSKAEARSLPQATVEIERLKEQIKELEQKLHGQNDPQSLPNASGSPIASNLRGVDPSKHESKPTEGAWSMSPNTHQRQLYGQSSTFFFVSRLCSFIGAALQQPFDNHQINPNAACKVFASPNSLGSNNRGDAVPDIEYLSRAQEDYFLGLFWQTYHCTIPILDEVEFREHYETLWVTNTENAFRKPSPLVDIILALCMQYGMAFVPRTNFDEASRVDIDINDSSIAGRSFYHRCQTLLMLEAETQSLTILQCYIYSTIYLRNASFVNAAHNTLAVAIRVAHRLGLHRDPAKHLPCAQRELRLRLWWTIYMMECKACQSLGQPWQMASISQMTCSLPADSQIVAQISKSNFISRGEDITWLSYHVHCVKLHIVVRAAHAAFDHKVAQVSYGKSGRYFFEDAKAQEDLAEWFMDELKDVRKWVQEVPRSLMTPRSGDGKPFSTDRSPLEIDSGIPVWLHRQQLLLELLYHNLVMTLYRPFIHFRASPTSSTPLADGHAISCLNHAVSTTNLIHQVLQGTDILNGCHEAYQHQWTATLSLVGFSFAYPICSAAPSARKALNTAKDVLDLFGNNFTTAASAAGVTRELTMKVDRFMDRFRTGMAPSQQLSTNVRPDTQSFQPFEPHGGPNDHYSHGSMPAVGMLPTLSMSSTADQAALMGMEFNFSNDVVGNSDAMWSEGNGFNANMWPVS